MKITKIICIISILFLSPLSNASFIYDESVDGDMGAAAGASPVWELTVGTNSIIGNLTQGDIDDFRVIASNGLEITGGTFEALFNGSGFGFYNSSGIPVVGGSIFQGTIAEDTLVEIDSFSSGLFRTDRDSADSDITYRYDFHVVDPNAVPSPSNFAFLLIAATGLTVRKVLKKSSQH